MPPPLRTEHLEPRVAKLETEVRQIREDIDHLGDRVEKTGERMFVELDKMSTRSAEAFASIEGKIASDRSEAAKRGKVSGTFVLSLCVGGTGIATALGTVIGLYITLIVSPIRTTTADHAGQLAKVSDSIAMLADIARHSKEDVRVYQTSHDAAMRELDTRLRWMDDVGQRRAAETYRLIQMLWRKAYQEDLPGAGKAP